MNRVTIKEVSLLRSGEMMEWIFKNCPSYDHGEVSRDRRDFSKFYYDLFFTDPRDVEWFTLKWFDVIVDKANARYI